METNEKELQELNNIDDYEYRALYFSKFLELVKKRNLEINHNNGNSNNQNA